jgi:cytoskeletal protein RodZ
MDKQNHQKNSTLLSKKRTLVVIIAALLLVVIVGLVFMMQPQRTVANFCQVAKDEKSTLVGDVNYEKRLEAYKKIESVSPDDIRPDISTIRKGYEEIVKNPSSTLSTGFGMSGAENRRDAYIDSNCNDF